MKTPFYIKLFGARVLRTAIVCMLLLAAVPSPNSFAQTPAPKPPAPAAAPATAPKPAAPAKSTEPDIIENLQMETPDGPWWYWWVIASSFLVLLIPLFFVFRRLYRKKMLPFQSQPVPPKTSALERLAGIRHYIEEGAVRDFVRESSEIVRTYIEARFGLKAPRLSTEEFLWEAEHSPHLDPSHRTKLAEFLFRCDRVKFGLGDMDTSRMESLYSAAEDFIKTTASAVAPAEPRAIPAAPPVPLKKTEPAKTEVAP